MNGATLNEDYSTKIMSTATSDNEPSFGDNDPFIIATRCQFIMNKILSFITDIKDRRNFELSCRPFYLASINEHSNRPLPGYIKRKTFQFFLSDEASKVKVSGNKIIINFEKDYVINKDDEFVLKNFMGRYFHLMDTLHIKRSKLENLIFLMKINTFKNIKTLIFDRYMMLDTHLHIFNYTNTLEPEKIIFNSAWSPNYFHLCRKNFIILKIPKSIRNIEFLDSKSPLELLQLFLEATQTKVASLETLKVGINYRSKSILNNIIKYFKKLILISPGNYVTSLLSELEETINRYNINIDISICPYFNNSLFRLNEVLQGSIHYAYNQSIFTMVTNFSQITSFKIHVEKFYEKKFSVMEGDVNQLREDLLLMDKLEHLEMDFRFFESIPNFSLICSSLRPTLKGIIIDRCERINNNHISILSRHCNGIEYLLFNGISSSQITIPMIIESFPKLNGLIINFSKSYKFEKILNTIAEYDELAGRFKVKWPEIKFLNIYSNYPDKKEKMILENASINTPRKSGHFMMRNISPHYGMSPFQIVVQKERTLYDNYKSLFSRNNT